MPRLASPEFSDDPPEHKSLQTQETNMILGSSTLRQLALLLFLPLALQSLAAQQQSVTAADYARAEKLLPGNLGPLVYGEVRPNWIDGADLFWYRKPSPGKSEFVLVDAAAGTQQPAFDHARLAAELSKLSGHTLAADHLPFQEIEFSTDMRSVIVPLGTHRFVCDRSGATSTRRQPPAAMPEIRRSRPTGSARPLSATGICGCAM